MKNIHILPTDKPSRLIYNDANQLCHQSNKSFKNDRKNRKKFNIYITSDEEIKEGDWCLFESSNIIRKAIDSTFASGVNNIIIHADKKVFKIILTTDQDLIKDGVQPIDDEFLEWFVKNPSCEYVNIEKYCRNGLCDSKSRSKRDKMDEHRHEDPKDKCWYSGCQCPGERLIVPKKNFYCGDEVDYDDKCLEQCDGCVDATGIDYGYLPKEIHLEDIFNDEKKEGIKKVIQKHKLIDMMEQDEQLGLYQETPEEAANKLLWKKYPYHPPKDAGYWKDMFNDGAKWQQERSYSEEEVLSILNELGWGVYVCYSGNIPISEWMLNAFEQFKKK